VKISNRASHKQAICSYCSSWRWFNIRLIRLRSESCHSCIFVQTIKKTLYRSTSLLCRPRNPQSSSFPTITFQILSNLLMKTIFPLDTINTRNWGGVFKKQNTDYPRLSRIFPPSAASSSNILYFPHYLEVFLFHLSGSLHFASHWTSQSHVPTVGILTQFAYYILKMKAPEYSESVVPNMASHRRRMQSNSYMFEKIKISLLEDWWNNSLSRVPKTLKKASEFVIYPLKRKEDNPLPKSRVFLFYSKTWNVFFLWM
jgi:hypothetical protein